MARMPEEGYNPKPNAYNTAVFKLLWFLGFNIVLLDITSWFVEQCHYIKEVCLC